MLHPIQFLPDDPVGNGDDAPFVGLLVHRVLLVWWWYVRRAKVFAGGFQLVEHLAAGHIRVLPVLTEDDIVAIRCCYATGKRSQGDLARMFLESGAGQPTIQRIVSGASHSDIAGPRTTAGRGNPSKRRSA